ncbi:thioredoxin family protein [Formosa sp. S-31]|uniref:thioredoxin family protein n=1 Tax=Formosa sp. S-31 TaxID=2790949 RepID=UPI003EBAF6D2
MEAKCTQKTEDMSKFGELIDVNIPVLLNFFTEWNEQSSAMHPVLRDVAAALGDKAKVIKIDVDKNKELAEALRVKGLPTLIIYKDGEMKWRQSGEQDANTLIGIVQKYI